MARSGAPAKTGARLHGALQNPIPPQASSPHERVSVGPADDERQIQSAAEKNDL